MFHNCWDDNVKLGASGQREFLLEWDFALFPKKIERLCYPHPHPISLLASFLPSRPPTAQVPVLVAVAGKRSSAVKSGSPTFLHAPVEWKSTQGTENLRSSPIPHNFFHSSFFGLSSSSFERVICPLLLPVGTYSAFIRPACSNLLQCLVFAP